MEAEKAGIHTQEISRKTSSTIVTLHHLLSALAERPTLGPAGGKSRGKREQKELVREEMG